MASSLPPILRDREAEVIRDAIGRPCPAAARHGSMFDMTDEIGELNPPPRLLMGPGPITCDPRVLRAMSVQLLGQFDPAFTAYMNEVMALYRRLFQTENRWSFPVHGAARARTGAILGWTMAP